MLAFAVLRRGRPVGESPRGIPWEFRVETRRSEAKALPPQRSGGGTSKTPSRRSEAEAICSVEAEMLAEELLLMGAQFAARRVVADDLLLRFLALEQCAQLRQEPA